MTSLAPFEVGMLGLKNLFPYPQSFHNRAG